MHKVLLICLTLGMTTLAVYAETSVFDEKQKMTKINHGQKIFRNKLQRKCGYTAGHFAQQHTQKEWNSFEKEGKFQEEFARMCPKGTKVAKDEWMEPLYLFATEYASDSDTRPRC